MSILFSPIKFGPLSLINRVVVAPMCQYSADQGEATDWHTIHLGGLALSGAGLMILEATAVNAQGRITYADLGLWNDATEQALSKTLEAIRPHSNTPIAIQLAHAGRKASTEKPWLGGHAISADEENGWQTIAPSAIAYDDDSAIPKEATENDINNIIHDFVESAKRAKRLGFNAIEIHAAHGYLLHQFLSPLSNLRKDQYGGSLENRMRLLLEIFAAVRDVMPDDKAVGVRISATDWAEGGWDLSQSIKLAKNLQQLDCNFLHVSGGGLSSEQKISVSPGYQVPYADAIKKVVTMPVIAVGLITEPMQAEEIINKNKADSVALARCLLYNPHWIWHAAERLNAKVEIPAQYMRCEPQGTKPHLIQSILKD
jgi:2,4-dienoyl-CoA reductase-like NADH-dependent reductase (Old Yellow Enzyme family)